MRTLFFKQPHISHIQEGLKTIELRSWYTDYRGPILACASQGFDTWADPDRKYRGAQRSAALFIVDLLKVGWWEPSEWSDRTNRRRAKKAYCSTDPKGSLWNFHWELGEITPIVPISMPRGHVMLREFHGTIKTLDGRTLRY